MRNNGEKSLKKPSRVGLKHAQKRFLGETVRNITSSSVHSATLKKNIQSSLHFIYRNRGVSSGKSFRRDLARGHPCHPVCWELGRPGTDTFISPSAPIFDSKCSLFSPLRRPGSILWEMLFKARIRSLTTLEMDQKGIFW